MKTKVIFVFILLAFQFNSNAQDTVRRVFDTGILDSLHSSILDQERLIEVFVPAAYKPGSTEKYDVLYVLDGGNWNTGQVNRIRRFLEDEQYMPPTIVVSVMGIDRNKDLTPTHVANPETSGGAANFLAFIRDELIPYINKKYPSNGDNTLWGHSYGGLFVVNALLQSPATFKSYIAADPSLWWDNEYIQKIAPDKLRTMAGMPPATLYIAGREGQDGSNMRIGSMVSILEKMAPPSLTWKCVFYPDETHSSVRFKAIYDGLKYTYGWQNGKIEYHPMNGVVLKNDSVKVWYFGDTSRVRYTLDGAEPTLSSYTVPQEIHVPGNTTIKWKQFTHRARYDKTASGQFKTGEALQPVKQPASARRGGFRYDYYEVEWNSFKGLKGLRPQLSGIADSTFNPANMPRKNNYFLVLDGLVEAKEAGYYIFVLNADIGAKLFLNNRQIIDWQGKNAHQAYSYILLLKKGFYQLRLEYPHRKEDYTLQIGYVTPSNIDAKKVTPIPFELQYSIRR